ncbi:MAG TPA: tRNA threonylcarbamoyladenosine dehydratase, partial [Thermoanaerobacterales bacterium]|nr:tRNA threonylcarbamoyladenosine dehydratase [Thermoanaerobacterales bacterium]
ILIDGDDVHITNINRQIHALYDTIGIPKVDVMAERIKKINPSIDVIPIKQFYFQETRNIFFKYNYDYIIDAIDTIDNKVDLISTVYNKNIPIISCMGAGNRIYPTKLQVCDIADTRVCPLARIVRKELRKKGIYNGIKVVYSTETPLKSRYMNSSSVGSFSFVPSVAGLIIAAEVVRDILNTNSFSF